MKAINEDKLMYKFCYKYPCEEELAQILSNRKPLATIFKRIERAIRKKDHLGLTPEEVVLLERYILALEIIEENVIRKLVTIKGVFG